MLWRYIRKPFINLCFSFQSSFCEVILFLHYSSSSSSSIFQNMGKQSNETQSPVSDPTKFSILNLIDLSNPNINQSVHLLKQVCKLFHYHKTTWVNLLCFFFQTLTLIYVFFFFKACLDSGFFYAVNHGISEDFMDEVFAQSKRFFSLPLKEKMKILRNEKHRGYTPVLDETLDPQHQLHGTKLLILLHVYIIDKNFILLKLFLKFFFTVFQVGDYKEGFYIGVEVDEDDPESSKPFYGTNKWPEPGKKNQFFLVFEKKNLIFI